ncbi:hypothetical protein [uncultured Gammaproteobacteria bacterium]|nr:hypothetical protein [uncultured Gammaproteobacteria bacterium]
MSVIKYVVKSQRDGELVASFAEFETKLEAMDWVTTLMLWTNDDTTHWECRQAEEFLELNDYVKFYDLENPEELRESVEDGY